MSRPITWVDSPSTSSPLSAADLNTATTRTVLSVKDYGAAGDGVTNDATAIQNALTAAGSAGGGVVLLPTGTYIINKYLLIPSNVWLRGNGMAVTTIKCGSTFTSGGGAAPLGGGYSMIQPTALNQTNVAISDITFDGNESINRTALTGSANRSSSYLVDLRQVTGLRLERIATRNSWTYNIAVIDSSKFIVTGCDVQSVNTTGVYNQLDGIHIWGSNQGRILGNHVDNGIGGDADDGLVAHVFPGGDSCYDLVYAANVVRGGAGGQGMQLSGATTGLIRDITIANNVFWGCPSGIVTNFYSASGNQPIRSVTIIGNTIRDTTTGPPIAIQVGNDGKWEDISIVGNIIDGFGSATSNFVLGIAVQGGNASRGITITGNVLRNGYARGIYLTGAPRDYVVANNVIDLTTASLAPVALSLSSTLDGSVVGNNITGRGTTDGLGISMDSSVAATATNQIVTGNRVRAFNTGITITNSQGNNPTNTIVTSNNTQGNGTGTSFGTATVTSANNL